MIREIFPLRSVLLLKLMRVGPRASNYWNALRVARNVARVSCSQLSIATPNYRSREGAFAVIAVGGRYESALFVVPLGSALKV